MDIRRNVKNRTASVDRGSMEKQQPLIYICGCALISRRIQRDSVSVTAYLLVRGSRCQEVVRQSVKRGLYRT